MKTAETTFEEWFETCSWSGTRITDKDKVSLLALLKQIQLDAFKAGMTEAAEIVQNEKGVSDCTACNHFLSGVEKAILSARDNLK